MKEQYFTDDQLEAFVENNRLDMTGLERQLAFTIQRDREAFNSLLSEIEPMAQQIISPKDNVFSRQIELINRRLNPAKTNPIKL